jgi:hypothetical protein
MVAWRVNRGGAVLVAELKHEHPGIVVGTIGDASHATGNPSSDHNPKKLNGANVVNAADPMISSKYTAQDADEDINAILRNPAAFARTKYIIWERRIISGPGGIKPGVWRKYTGTSDPHTGHWHISWTDDADEDTRPWLKRPEPRKVTIMRFTVSIPQLKEGDNDTDFPGYNVIQRLQDLLGVEADGDWGPKTSAAIKARGFGNGKTLTEEAWRSIFGAAN